ncbi:MAG TPA: recombinase family protein [Gammaproteobacteria bacterium]|nr:recombinase family protein [Gammaproteobacteria bacterium]
MKARARRAAKGDPKRAVGYLRVSTEDQRLGPEAQRDAIERWAAREGVRVVAWHCDQGVSGGAPLDQRPALLDALLALQTSRAGVLVVAKRDRLARDVFLAAMVEQKAGAAGAQVISAAGEGTGGDEDDPAAQLMRRMVDAFAEYERALIRARTRAALRAKARRRERVGSVPWGFELSADAVHLELSEHEQAVLARIAALRAEGTSLRGIVATLDAEGVTGRAGTPLQLKRVALLVRRLRLNAPRTEQ